MLLPRPGPREALACQAARSRIAGAWPPRLSSGRRGSSGQRRGRPSIIHGGPQQRLGGAWSYNASFGAPSRAWIAWIALSPQDGRSTAAPCATDQPRVAPGAAAFGGARAQLRAAARRTAGPQLQSASSRASAACWTRRPTACASRRRPLECRSGARAVVLPVRTTPVAFRMPQSGAAGNVSADVAAAQLAVMSAAHSVARRVPMTDASEAAKHQQAFALHDKLCHDAAANQPRRRCRGSHAAAARMVRRLQPNSDLSLSTVPWLPAAAGVSAKRTPHQRFHARKAPRRRAPAQAPRPPRRRGPRAARATPNR
jgi:hypothetical protein